MVATEELYSKFPTILRDKLTSGEVKFPDNTNFMYNAFYAYRMVERKDGNLSPVTVEDFRSYAELGKKLPRGKTKDIEYYSASLYTSLENMRNVPYLIKPGRYISGGFVLQDKGPHNYQESTTHVNWWLYKDVSVNNFSIIE